MATFYSHLTDQPRSKSVLYAIQIINRSHVNNINMNVAQILSQCAPATCVQTPGCLFPPPSHILDTNGTNYQNRFTVITPGQENAGADRTLQIGRVSFLTINGAPLGVRFWSGWEGGAAAYAQYINFTEDNGFHVTADTSTFTEVRGNGVRVTLDGGGYPCDSWNIFIQIYDA